MFSLICTGINGWVSNREAGDLRRHCARYDVIVMLKQIMQHLWCWDWNISRLWVNTIVDDGLAPCFTSIPTAIVKKKSERVIKFNGFSPTSGTEVHACNQYNPCNHNITYTLGSLIFPHIDIGNIQYTDYNELKQKWIKNKHEKWGHPLVDLSLEISTLRQFAVNLLLTSSQTEIVPHTSIRNQP